MKLLKLILKNLLRNKVRSILTVLAIFLLVAIFTLIATVIVFLDKQMAEQSKDVLAVITERYRIPSRFDRKYMEDIAATGSTLNSNLSNIDGFHGENTNLWHFVGFTLDPTMQDKDKFFFVIACWPDKINTMVDGMKGFDDDGNLIKLMKTPPVSGVDNIGILLGPERLKKLGKKVGDVFKATSVLHKGADGKQAEFELEIVGELPGGSRWAQGGFMDFAYLNRVLKAINCDLDGKVNLGWIMTDDQKSAIQSAGTIESFLPDVKCETLSSAVSRFLEPFKDILWGVKWLLVPAIFAVMTVIVANAISITVRERRMEIAVLKVLGYGPNQIMFLILGEGILLGTLAGGLSATTVWALMNNVKLQILFFGGFNVPDAAVAWGFGAGALTALIGSIGPAISARSVKVVDVFSRVA
ncbi:MAG TPA: ABC transporter permease [Gemmatales bacterium]|nr:ABC transporter permease [Gemmatales bacterium]